MSTEEMPTGDTQVQTVAQQEAGVLNYVEPDKLELNIIITLLTSMVCWGLEESSMVYIFLNTKQTNFIGV